MTNAAQRQRFKDRVCVGDLRVNKGSWAWTQAAPRPSWSCLSRAKVWYDPDDRFVSLRESLKYGPVFLDLAPGSTDTCATINVKSGDREVPVTVYLAKAGPTGGAAIHPDANTSPDITIAWVDDAPIPRHLWRAIVEGKPCFLYSENSTFLETMVKALKSQCEDLRWLDVMLYSRPKEVLPFATFCIAKRYCKLVGPQHALSEKV